MTSIRQPLLHPVHRCLRWQAARRVRRKIVRGEYRLEQWVCCLCNSADLEMVHTKELYGFPVKMGICRQCGLGVLTPRLDEASLAAFYQQKYRRLKFGSTRASVIASEFGRGRRRGRYIGEFLGQHGIPLKGQRVVEVGCGPGGILHWFAGCGATVVGCDLDPEAIAYAQQQGVQIVAGDINAVLGAHPPVDIVVLSHVLEHMPHSITFLQQARRMLKPGGYLYVEVPGMHCPRANLARTHQIVHLYYFTLTTLKMCLSRAGFNLENGNEIVQAVFR